jgi:SAM-dependent methyltransferase
MRIVDPLVPRGVIAGIKGYVWFIRDWWAYRRAGGVAHFLDWYPCLEDRTATTHVDRHYLYQAIWAFQKIVETVPPEHVDIGSDVKFVGMLTAVTNVRFVDIRPLDLSVRNYRGISGSLLALPFTDESLSSVSSLHVIEHVGLGRYGDPVDPRGSLKAAREIVRVLARGGTAYVSVPIGRSRVQFNGQRVFAVREVLDMFEGLRLKEMAIVEADGRYKESVTVADVVVDDAGAGGDCVLGMFRFQKPID